MIPIRNCSFLTCNKGIEGLFVFPKEKSLLEIHIDVFKDEIMQWLEFALKNNTEGDKEVDDTYKQD